MAETDRRAEPDEVGEPPQPPEMARRARIHGYQWIGLSIMGAVVLAAMLGAFGETRRDGSTRVDGLSVEHRHPTRFRYKTIDAITLTVTNTSGSMLDTVTVSFDTAYMNRFSNVSIVPSPARAWDVELVDVQPGESRIVVAEIQAEHYWRHAGTIEVSGPGTDTARIDIATISIP